MKQNLAVFVCHAVAASAVLVGQPATQTVAPDISYVQIQENGVGLRDAVLHDIDGDGRRDLIVSTGRHERHGTLPRRLWIHLRRSQGFVNQADRTLTLVRDVVAFAVGDVHPNPGSEIVLLSPSRAVAVYWQKGRKEPRYAALIRSRLLWQPADPRTAFAWHDGLRDIDGDGLVDLLLPESRAYRVALQRRKDGKVSFGPVSELRVPAPKVRIRDRGEVRFELAAGRFEASFSMDRRRYSFLMQIKDTLPAPQLADWNGDGRLDVMALADLTLHLWQQEETGAFAIHPIQVHELDERAGRAWDPSYSARLSDVDGDGRPDLIVVTSRTVDDEVQSRVEILRRTADGGLDAKRGDRLRMTGFVSVPELDDLDGDGKPELVIVSLRPDLIDTLTAGSSELLEAQLNVFKNEFTAAGGRFKRPVALVHKIRIQSDMVSKAHRIHVRFFGDVDGDGTPDLLLRTEPNIVRILRTRKDGSSFRLGPSLWELKVADDARVRSVSSNGSVELLVIEPRQVICVQFR